MQVAPKPVKYAVCQEDRIDMLSDAVNRALSNGYQPHGDLHVHKICEQTMYTQAMIKIELRPLELPADLEQNIQPSSGLLIPRPVVR